MVGFITILYLIYIAILLSILKLWRSDLNHLQSSDEPSFSIVIPVRNEEKQIKECIDSILRQSYSSFEVLIVDDHSTDKTSEIVESYSDDRIGMHANIGTGKKRAISTGIAQAKFPWIVTVDGDTQFLPDWLSGLASYTSKFDCLVGPVQVCASNGILSGLQVWDMVAMQGFTKSGINSKRYFMANGTNLAFKKAWFYEVDGYDGNLDIASGDDYFLIDKFSKSRMNSIGYLPLRQCVGSTSPLAHWSEFLAQRMRWGAKMKRMENSSMQFVLGFIWLVNIIWLVMVFSLFFGSLNLWMVITLLLIKMLADFTYLSRIGKFFDKRLYPMRFLIIAPIHSFYIVLTGIISLLPLKVFWKGRKV